MGYAGGVNLYNYTGNDPVNESDPLGFCGGGNPISNFYWGGMGGLSNWVSNNLLDGSDKNLGSTVGDYDAGKASAWDVAGAGAMLAGNIALTAAPGGEEARGAEIAFSSRGLAKVAKSGGGEQLTRYAGGKESATRLGRLAQESLENPEEGIHGISTTAGEVNPDRAFSTLPREVVEQNFPVHDTPFEADPLHRTVELPNPVTPDIAKIWNQMWGFK